MPIASLLESTPIAAATIEEFSPRSVLLVEDNKDLAEGLAELLRLHGVFVRVAYNGPSAIKTALESAPDIILCDLGLPG